MIEAAGGVVWRRAPTGLAEVLLVHRPRYDDWTFPKGKLEPGEAPREAAWREVLEETGFDCALGDEVAETSYEDRKGRPKHVQYWTMSVLGGAFVPNHEVDEIRWCTVDEAVERLTYPRDRVLLTSLPIPPGTSPS